LWIEQGDVDPLDDPPAAPGEKRPKRLPRSGKYFARVPLLWLATSERDGGYPAWVRLHLCLWFRSRQGKQTVRLTNAIAAEAHLDRHSKLRRLQQLEARGLVTVARAGKAAPVVTVHPMPGTSVRVRDDPSL
jgi:hypothetical protein